MSHRLLCHLRWLFVIVVLGYGCIATLFSACTKIEYTPNSGVRLSFSNDSILFDTVFTSVGSTTRRVKIFNTTNKNILIKEIYLAGVRLSARSAYRLNINGLAANETKDIELAAKDSMYIFAEVRIDPTQNDLPFVVSDSIMIDVGGGVLQKIYLDAYGQNANFIRKGVLACNQVWSNTKPYVVVDSILVAQGCTLRIEQGTKVYFHAGASLLVAGTLHIAGSATQPVSLQNDRLDPPYNQISGSWAGIHLLSSSINNTIDFALIYNAINGIRTDSLATNAAPKLRLSNSVVHNSAAYGLLCFTGSVQAHNALIADNKAGNFGAALGGDYVFRHCSFVSDRSVGNSSFYANNDDLRTEAGATVATNALRVALKNCIIWSGLEDNLTIENVGAGTITTDITYNIVKQMRTTGLPLPTNLFNINLKFVKPSLLDYRPDSLNAACGKGEDLSVQFPFLSNDLSGKLRSTPPTAGCLECKD